LGDAGSQRDDAGDVGRIHRLGDATENDFIHQRRIQRGPGQQGVDSDAPEFIGAEGGQVGPGAAERGSDPVDNDQALGSHKCLETIQAQASKPARPTVARMLSMETVGNLGKAMARRRGGWLRRAAWQDRQ
jgi:hypothetical protein